MKGISMLLCCKSISKKKKRDTKHRNRKWGNDNGRARKEKNTNRTGSRY